MENSIIKAFSDDILSQVIYTGETFTWDAKTDMYDIEVNNRTIYGCFGPFTHNYRLPRNKPIKYCRFRYFFKFVDTTSGNKSWIVDSIFKEAYGTKHEPNKIRNAMYIQTTDHGNLLIKNASLAREYDWLTLQIQRYVPFTTRLNMGCQNFWSNGCGLSETNAFAYFEFKDRYLFEIFLVLNCFRKLLQITSYPYYKLAQKLYIEKWHNLDFINILSLMDMTDIIIPGDQRWGMMFMNKCNYSWITKETIERSRKVASKQDLPLCKLIVPLTAYESYRQKSVWKNKLLNEDCSDPYDTSLKKILSIKLDQSKMEEIYTQVNLK